MKYKTKTVALPIKVPLGKFCWSFFDKEQPICEHYNNEGGHSRCDIGFWIQREHEKSDGIHKPDECLSLKEVEND